MIGQTVSHYKILEKLGEGGMGVVYKAEDVTLKRTVALKFLPKGLETHEPERARFLQEAQAASAINHPNVCTIYDIREEGDQQFIVMEFVDGKTLRQIVPIQKMQDVFTYAIQIGEALQEAHSYGIVHRDVKPENIMINSKNQVKVMDFGLAKLKGSLKLTRTSSTVGTLAYMAPEQIQGEAVDARGDIFSFGIVLYEMLTGNLPFRGEHEAAIMYSIVNETPEPIQKYRPDVSSELLHVLNRALEKDPEDRYQTVREMVIDLRRVKKESVRVSRSNISPRPADRADAVIAEPQELPKTAERRSPRKTLLWIGGLSVLLLIAAFVIFIAVPSHPSRLNPNRTTTMLKTPFRMMDNASVSRDGNWVAFPAANENGKWDIYWMNVASEKVSRITDKSAFGIANVEISPDLSQIAYGEEEQWNASVVVKLVSSQGGESRMLADTGIEPKWSPDGQRIGYWRGGGSGGVPSVSGKFEVWSIRPDGTDPRLELIDTVSEPRAPNAFSWSPDGRSIGWIRNFPGGYGEVMVRELATGKELQITSDRKAVDEVIWTANDEILYVSNKSGQTNLWTIPAGGGAASQVTEGGIPITAARISGDTRTLVYMQEERVTHIWISALDGSNARQVTFEDAHIYNASLSPDGESICYPSAGIDAYNAESHLCMVDRDGKNQRQLTSGPEIVNDPCWSPNGKWLAYQSRSPNEPEDSSKVYIIQPLNPGPRRILCNGSPLRWINDENLLVLRRMKTLLYSINGGTPTQIYQDSTAARPLVGTTEWVIFDFRTGHEGVWVVSLDSPGKPTGAPRKIHPRINIDYSLSPDGRFLIYRKPPDELWRVCTSTGKEELIGKALPGEVWLIGGSWDGKDLLWGKEDNRSKLVLIKNVFE